MREHAHDTGLTERAAELNVADEGVVALGTVDLDVQQPCRFDILEELRAAGHVAPRVRALHRLADHVEVVVALGGEEAAIDLLRLDHHQATVAAAARRAAAARIAAMINA